MEQSIEIFPWSENFNTGLPQVDEQHRRLVQLVNVLGSHVAFGSEAPKLISLLDELTEYTHYHFRTEEDIWHRYFTGDPAEIEHHRAHETFIEALTGFKNKANAIPLESLLEDILTFLTRWLAFHILEDDKRMAMLVFYIQSGMTIENARAKVSQEMSGASKVLIETVMTMYDSLSKKSLQLAKEIIQRQNAEAELRLAAIVFGNTLEAICFTDADFGIIEVNPAFLQSTGYANEEVIGRKLKDIKAGITDGQHADQIQHALASSNHWQGEIWSYNKGGETMQEWLTISCVKDEAGRTTNYVMVFSNISFLIRLQEQLKRSAYHDALTSLPNRLLLADRMEFAIVQAKRARSIFAVCYFDLDAFKPVNDKFGHATGDVVLQEVAGRMKNNLRGIDTIARVGGDEFVILLNDMSDEEECRTKIKILLRAIEQPIQIGDIIVGISASFGVAFFPQDGLDPEILLQRADTAMYRAKKAGKAGYVFYNSD